MAVKKFYELDNIVVPSELEGKYANFMCGRWTLKSSHQFYSSCLSSATVETALSYQMLRPKDLTEDELDYANRIFQMAVAKELNDVQSRLKNGTLDSKSAETMFRYLFKISAVAEDSTQMSVQPILNIGLSPLPPQQEKVIPHDLKDAKPIGKPLIL